MRKPLFLTTIIMLFLLFLWWFSGGTIIGAINRPAPFEIFASFAWDNFQTGAATIFEAFSRLLGI